MIDYAKLDEEQKKSFDTLKDWLTKSKKIYTKLVHVSNSGMFRLISVYLIKENEPYCLDYFIHNLGIEKRDSRREGLRVSGCGMDMGFHVVYNLMSAIFGPKYDWQKEKRHEWL